MIEDGIVGIEEYEKMDEKVCELFRCFVNSKLYFCKGCNVDEVEVVEVDVVGGNLVVGVGIGGFGLIWIRDLRVVYVVGVWLGGV